MILISLTAIDVKYTLKVGCLDILRPRDKPYMNNKGIDVNRISYPKVRRFVLARGLDTLDGFDSFRSTCYVEGDRASYHRHFEQYHVDRPIDATWRAYMMTHPRDAWAGKMISFGAQYSSQDRCVSYMDDPFGGMQVGHLIVLNLSIAGGLVNIAVAHKVAEIDPENYSFKLCYMEGGASEGSQWISLRPSETGGTEVHHLTFYKSDSLFRDKVLYPGLHTKAISEYHRNIRMAAESA